MECGWLLLLVLPLFFNAFSAQETEPDRMALTRSLALVLAALWIARLVANPVGTSDGPTLRARLRGAFSAPLAIPATALAAAYVLATCLSINPHASWWGSYQRLQGTYSMLSYVVVFAIMAANLRRREQLERVFSTTIVTAFAVSGYVILQHFRLDVIDWLGDTPIRPFGSLGNPIFFGAYAIMAVPLATARLIRAFNDRENAGSTRLATIGLYCAILAVQVAALIFCGSRGPWMGGLAGLLVFGMLVSVSAGWPKIALAITASAIGAAGLFLLLNVSNGPLQPVRDDAHLKRLSHILEASDATSKVRILIWSGVVKMVLPHAALVYPDGAPDRLNAIRPLVGYGPETMLEAYTQFSPPSLVQVEGPSTWDRSHNQTFDALVTTGLLGMLAYLALIGAAFYSGLKLLGLVDSERRWVAPAYELGGAAIGATAGILVKGPAYFGVSVSLGMLLGACGYLAAAAYRRRGDTSASTRKLGPLLAGAALVGGIAGHFAETQVGIAIGATWLQLWIYLACLTALFLMPANESGQPVRASEGTVFDETFAAGSQATANWLLPTCVVSFIMLTLGYDFLRTDGSSNLPLLLLFGSSWALAIVLLAFDLSSALKALLVSAACFGAFAIVQLKVFSISFGTVSTPNEIVQTVVTRSRVFTIFGAWALAVMAAGGASAARRSRSARWRRGSDVTIGVLACALAVATGYVTNTLPIRADMLFKAAQPSMQAKSWEVVAALDNQAVKYAPGEGEYRLGLGQAYSELAPNLPRWAEQKGALTFAESQLKVAQALNPLDPVNTANLARLAERWAVMTPDQTEAADRLKQANSYFGQATMLAPNSAELWREWAQFDQRHGLTADAAAHDKRAASIH